MTESTERQVVYRFDAGGTWTASVRGLPRLRGWGKTVRLARKRLRAALAQSLGDEGVGLTFVEDVRLPGGARRLVLAHWKARRAAEARRRQADEAARSAAEALRALRLSPRDVGDLLGLSAATLASLRGRR